MRVGGTIMAIRSARVLRSRAFGFGALLLSAFCCLAVGATGCAADPSDGTNEEVAEGEDALTSVTARSRSFEFVGTVFVERGASDASIMQTVRTQSQTAFGPLRTAEAAVNLLAGLGAEVVAACFIVDLPELGGADKIRRLGVPVRTLVSFGGH